MKISFCGPGLSTDEDIEKFLNVSTYPILIEKAQPVALGILSFGGMIQVVSKMMRLTRGGI